MLRTLFLLTATLCVLSSVVSARAQAAQPSAQNTPQALLATYDEAMKAKDWPAAIAAAQQSVESAATAENLRLLGNAQSNSGAPQEAIATYDHALAAAETEKPAADQSDSAWKDEKSKILLARGNAYLRLHRNSEAIDSYSQAAALAADPGIATFNICATYFNLGDTQNALAACRKAAAVNPSNASAWFVLGSILFADASMDSNGKAVITDETRHAFNKYLELAPAGPPAADVKAMLNMAAK